MRTINRTVLLQTRSYWVNLINLHHIFSSEVNKITGYISDYVVINVHHTNMVSQMKVASYAIVTQVVQMDSNVMQTVNVHVMTMSKADDVTDVKRTNIIVI